MSGFVSTPSRAFVAAAARDRFLRVYLNSGTLATAGASDLAIGTQEVESLTTTELVGVRLKSAPGTCRMVASEAITAGADVYAAASGKIASTGTVREGIALEAAGANGDIIEVLPANPVYNVTGSSLTLSDDGAAILGTGSDAYLLWSTADASDHSLVLGLGDTSQMLHITDKGARASDWAITSPTHPNVYVHSNTTPITDYLRIGDHDGTEADIDVVGGTSLALKFDGTAYGHMTTTGLDLIDAIPFYVGTGLDAGILWSTGDASAHALVIAAGDSNGAVHVTDKAAMATDWNLSADTHPNLYLHSNTTPATDYLRIGDHDGTEADIDVVGGTSLALKIAGTEYASLRVTGLAVGAYVAAATPGTDQVTIKSTGTAPAGTGADVGHLYADFESDDDELFWLSGTGGTATQLTT